MLTYAINVSKTVNVLAMALMRSLALDEFEFDELAQPYVGAFRCLDDACGHFYLNSSCF